MFHYSTVGFLTFGVYLFVCLSATANATIENPTEVTEAEANQAVETAKTSTNKVFEKAKETLSNANSALNRVKALETDVQKIESLGGEAEAKVAKEAKDNNDAKTIVEKIKNVFKTVNDLYRSATGDLENAISRLTELRNNGEALEIECSTAALVITDAKDNIKAVNDKAVEIKGKADKLENDIDDASSILTRVDSTEKNMMKGLKDAQLANLHVSAIVSVAKIQSMMEEADNIIDKTKEQNVEVRNIVQQMKELKTTAKGGLIESCDALFQKANDDSSNVSGALNNANQAKTDITRQKGLADTALTNVPKQSEVTEAQKELAKVEACVEECKEIVAQLKRGLLTAENSVRKAKALKQQMVTALSTKNSEPGTEQSLTMAQVKPLHDSVSAAVSEIQILMGEAGNTLKKTEKHKQEVHDIVEEMKKLKATAKSESNEDIKAQYKTAEDELTKAKSAVDNAKRAIGAITQQKELADTALQNVQKAKELSKAQDEVNNAKRCVEKVKESVRQLSSALDAAEIAQTNAKASQQQMLKALSPTTSAPTTEEVKETEKANLSVQGGTAHDQTDAKTQPKITNTEQPTSTDALNQGDNSADKLKDKLIKSAQNVPTTALIGGKAPAPGAKNDSAMTVSVLLLVALIASAVLQ